VGPLILAQADSASLPPVLVGARFSIDSTHGAIFSFFSVLVLTSSRFKTVERDRLSLHFTHRHFFGFLIIPIVFSFAFTKQGSLQTFVYYGCVGSL